MSLAARIVAGTLGAAGLAAGAAAVGVTRRRRVIARRGTDDTPLGSLRSPAVTVIAGDGVPLHVEVDELPETSAGDPAPRGRPSYGQRGQRSRRRPLAAHRRLRARLCAEPGLLALPACGVPRPGPHRLLRPALPRSLRSLQPRARHHRAARRGPARGPRRRGSSGPRGPGRPLDGRHDHRGPGRAAPRALRRPGGRRRAHLDHRGWPRSQPDLPSPAARQARRRGHRPHGAHLARGHRLVDGVRRAGRSVALVATDLVAFGDAVPQSYVDFVDQMLSATPFEVVAEFFPSFGSLDKFHAVQVLSRVPTAIVCGTADRLTSIGHSRKLHARIEGSTLLECEGAGHLVVLERHDQVNAALDQLLSASGARIGLV